MSVFESLFGTQLRDSTGQLVATSTALNDVDAVLVYFSAHWCGPCRQFTPQLAQSYKTMKEKGLKFDVVFVSSDRDEHGFDEYVAEMPWLSLPYSERTTKAALSKKYKVDGIPTLVVLDNQGNTITTDACSAISEDPNGEKFPWIPPTFAECLGDRFLGKDGVEVSASELRGKVLGLYFSAHWCPPCRGFTPTLAEVYNKAQQNFPGQFEIVFVSSDRDEESFREYHSSMPWLALPYDDRARKQSLSQLFEVSGIPKLVFVNVDTGKVINDNGRSAIVSDPEGKNFPWNPPLVNDLESPDGINESASLVVFVDALDAQSQEQVIATVSEVAKEYVDHAGGDELPFKFFIAKTNGEIASRVRTLTKVTANDFKVLLLDIPSGGKFYDSDFTLDGFTQSALKDYLSTYTQREQKSFNS
eukprot:c7491_g1_i1.p1 GENE.c7491_g1_i1~~c7491_g1_i1.p1  ORF type:complete len:416 (+),score=94.95 c7491_g1_i1:90-1337(+)